ncbi:hypothetical protein Btru_015209 [Bulinus truncatus]|nr:hypothetical protein Btru_015209 [Bulinus truncatus]
MMWRFIFSITDALPEIFNANKKISYYHADIPPRYEICINKTTHVLDLAISALYVDSNFQFNFQSRPKVSATVHKITNEIVTNLKNLKWLDYRTLKHLEKKSELLKYNIGYPDWIMDVDKLDEHYKQLKVEGEKYLDNYLNTSRYINRKNLELLWKSPDEQWIQSPIAGAPFYFNRTIYITTGYIQPPFYDPTFPVVLDSPINTCGGVLDSPINTCDGVLDSPINTCGGVLDSAISNMNTCGRVLDSPINEYIFDNGAVRHTFQVYKENDEEQYKIFPGLNLTEDQLFFLGFSQSMCSVYSQPKKTAMKDFSTYEMYRVIGSLSNSEDFAKAFNCPVNSSMNPENKCQIW